MTLDELTKKYDGKFVEVAGSANALNQCVDWVNLYIRDVLGLPIIEWTNAKDFPEKADKKLYDWIVNTPTGVPQKGDIVIWSGQTGGGNGHIAVFLEGNTSKFTSLDQNWPLASPVHKQNHYYTNVRGWLRPKVSVTPSDPINELQECKTDRDLNWDAFNKVMEAIGIKANPDDKMGSAESAVKSYTQTKERSGRVSGLEEQLKTIDQAYIGQISTLNGQLLIKDNTIDTLKKEIGKPSTQPEPTLDPHIKQLKAQADLIVEMGEKITKLEIELAGKPKQSFISWLQLLFKRK